MKAASQAEEALKPKWEQAPPNRDAQIRRDPFEMEKMSEVLQDFVAPWMAEVADERGFRELLYYASIAWNLSLKSKENQENLWKEKPLRKMPPQSKAFIEELIKRKEKFFAKNRRSIIDFQMAPLSAPQGGNIYFNVLSTLDTPPDSKLDIPPGFMPSLLSRLGQSCRRLFRK